MIQTHSRPDAPPIVLAWEISTYTGWGLYGYHLALQLTKRGRRVYSGIRPDLQHVPRPLQALLPSAETLLPATTEPLLVVHALGNDFRAPVALDLPNPQTHIGLTVFEDTGLSAEHVANLRQYDRLIAPSAWCASILAEHGIPDVPVIQQGYDASTFHPAPKLRGNDGRLLIFSGGKLEYRKGQDIVIAAFRELRKAVPHAVLVTAWHNPWPQTMEGLPNAGYVKGIPTVRHGVADLSSWLQINGVPPEAHMDVGQLTQAQTAQVIRECDVGLFPNRAEGASNMVLSECLAVGLPCLYGDWTGHGALSPAACLSVSQTSTKPAIAPPNRLYRGTEGWYDADPLNGPLSIPLNYTQPVRSAFRPPSWADQAPQFDAAFC